MALAARPIMPLSSTRSELLKKRLDQFTRVLNLVEQGDVRGLHRARVASRRLRELLPMLQLDADKARKLGRRLKKVTTRLGTVRELDVLLLLVDEQHVSGRSRSSALGRVGISVAKDRDDARKKLSTRLPIAGMRRLAEKLDVRTILIPTGAGVGSAVGFLLAAVGYEIVRTRYSLLDGSFEAGPLGELRKSMREEAEAVVRQGGRAQS